MRQKTDKTGGHTTRTQNLWKVKDEWQILNRDERWIVTNVEF